MKVYIRVLLLFAIAYSVGIIVRVVFQYFKLEELYVDLAFKAVLGIAFSFLIYFFAKTDKLFMSFKWKPNYAILILLLLLLFGANNFFQVKYSRSLYYSETLKQNLIISSIGYIVSSVSEEIIYRGFVQQYINENLRSSSFKISKGNFIATFLFLLSHLGFFLIMPPLFVVASLFTVVVFSLVAGYLLDSTKNIWLPISVHICINMLHILIQVGFS